MRDVRRSRAIGSNLKLPTSNLQPATSSIKPMLHRIVLYTRPGCHLCESAARLLLELRGEFALTIKEVDITADRELLKNYFDKIPVVQIDDRVTLAAPICKDALRAALTRS